MTDWTPTRDAGLARLEAFLPRAGRQYRDRRNHDFGPGDRSNVSALSPWLAHRLVHEREVISAALAEHGPEGAEKFVQEVVWRGYFRGWLEQRPGVWVRYLDARDRALMALDKDKAMRADWEAAVEGRTGIEGFDDWARELVEHGWLHNHARMWFASIWIFTLRLPWSLGADFFLRHLMDGDAASNTLSWRWVGGLHTKGKTYLARRDNIRKYAGGRFDPEGLSDDDPIPEAPETPDPAPLPEADPEPAEALWLLTEDDLSPAPEGPVAVLDGPMARSPLELGAHAAAFTGGALDDAAGRLGATRVGSVQEIVQAARDAGRDAIAVRRPLTGPVADRLDGLDAAAEGAGLALHLTRDPYDAAVWPHCRKGFFAVKKQIPRLIDELEL